MLNEIIATKQKEIETLTMPPEQSFHRRSLKQHLQHGAVHSGVGVIAEVKKASPSKGVLNAGLDPAKQAGLYEKSGADAVSVLTDSSYFQGSHYDLIAVKEAIQLPVLRKDFIIEKKQIEESVRMGADAILLIAAALPSKALKILHEEAEASGLECLVEVHNDTELTDVLNEFTPALIGVNNRNLKTFETSLNVTDQVAAFVPEESFFISESGIRTAEDVTRITKAGAKGMLIGETLVTSEQPQETLTKLKEGAV
ncbi:indole-3-glycerol phosphate synthase TrpC [Salsuginibacillus kocurii]|uniref:indole-3-glycerol phosphate synthase TrpC n=1 Tax=Salsuginibacillus kocurii TaxID=427078 RepID=UPI00035C9E17|nr:indole-3-glycerol phosphate synthase TrpC [Salsuginibacillus kocurii]